MDYFMILLWCFFELFGSLTDVAMNQTTFARLAPPPYKVKCHDIIV